MKRLTTDTPDGNFETVLNFVYGKDGWAYIRDGGEGAEVSLTQWAKNQCLRHGCDEFSAQTPEEIDMEVGDCVMDFPDCPIALAYCFASQAVHLRSRLKMYEDVLYGEAGNEIVTINDLRQLRAQTEAATSETSDENSGSRAAQLRRTSIDEMAELLSKGCCNLDLNCVEGTSCFDCWIDWLNRRENDDEPQ